eukprot:UN28876
MYLVKIPHPIKINDVLENNLEYSSKILNKLWEGIHPGISIFYDRLTYVLYFLETTLFLLLSKDNVILLFLQVQTPNIIANIRTPMYPLFHFQLHTHLDHNMQLSH